MTSTRPGHPRGRSVTDPVGRSIGRRLAWPLAFVAWTLFVWGGRLRNLVQEPGPLADANRWSLVASIAFVSLALGLAAVAVTAGRLDRATTLLVPTVAALGALTVAVWVPRAVDIAIGDHDLGFIVVHVVLAVVSIVLAAVALVATRRRAGAGSRHPVGYPRSDG